MSNIFDNPEDFGLKVWTSVDTGGGYDFTTTVVFQGPRGELTYAQDSGCSCPTPFEDVKLPDLKLITPDSYDSFVVAVMEHHQYSTGWGLAELQQMVRDVWTYLRSDAAVAR